jgi:hypothetical protein
VEGFKNGNMTRQYLALQDLFITEGCDEGTKCFTQGKLYDQIYPDFGRLIPVVNFACLMIMEKNIL